MNKRLYSTSAARVAIQRVLFTVAGSCLLAGWQGLLCGAVSEETSELMDAHKYIIMQEAILGSFPEKFPELSRKSQMAQMKFERSALGAGAEGVTKKLIEISEPGIEEYFNETKEKMSAYAQRQPFSREFAEDKIAQVSDLRIAYPEDFSVPRDADGILATLLRFNPTYQESPAQEMLDGWKKDFHSRGEFKAKGLDFVMSYPASWKPKESNSPNIVRQIYSENGHGRVNLTVNIRDIGAAPSADEAEQFYKDESIRQMAKTVGFSRILEAKGISMLNRRAGFIVGEITQKFADIEIEIRMTRYVFNIDSKLVMLDFMQTTDPEQEAFTNSQNEELQALFKVMAASFNDIGRFR